MLGRCATEHQKPLRRGRGPRHGVLMRRRVDCGFTLLEILVAVVIFAFVASAAMTVMADSDYMAASGKRARELRMLAERKLGEVLAFERHFDDLPTTDGDFQSDYPEYGDRFKGWTWSLEVDDFTVFGISSDPEAKYLFGAPTDDEKAQAAAQTSGAGSSSGASGQPGNASAAKTPEQKLRRLILRVSSPTDEGAGDTVEITMFAPLLAPKQGASKGGN
jgi:prepilin-type N-terminal cleavage/methylation domain-containing protein